MIISIHTPLTRCDQLFKGLVVLLFNYFNPHTSHEVRQNTTTEQKYQHLFQSTHLSRGATSAADKLSLQSLISIHTPLTRCDLMPKCCFEHSMQISIHTPLTRCDKILPPSKNINTYFNPHTSHEVRHN